MDTATSTLMAKMSELRLNRDDADVTFNCNGRVIKAHSLILGMRYIGVLFPFEYVHYNIDLGLSI